MSFYSFFKVFPYCISKLLAGLAFSLANTFGNIPGFVAPVVVGSLLTDYSDVTQWRAVFWISAGVHVLGSLAYLLWGSDKLQPWADINQNKTSSHSLKSKETEIRTSKL